MPKPVLLATVRDVANRANVSPATVSRAFNAPDLLDAKTLERVRAAARDLKYQPHGVARSLRSRRSMVVGAIIQSMENASHIADMVELCQTLLAQRGYTMLLATSHFSDEQAVESARAMARQGIDALMLLNGHRGTGVFPLLRDMAIPYVAAWTPIRGEPSCGFDHRRAMKQMADHLLDLGHTQFAFVAPLVRSNDRRADRLRGVLDALKAHGIAPTNCHVVDDGGFGLRDGRAALARVLERAPQTTAVICANDNLAAGAILECRARGLRTPQDMSITGYNDLEIAGAFDPGVTTIGTPFAPVAQGVVDYLLARMSGETPPPPALLPTTLIARASSGPCSALRAGITRRIR